MAGVERALVVVTHNYPTETCPWAGIFVKEHAKRFNNPIIVHAPLKPLLEGMWRIANIEDGRQIVCHWWIPWGWLCAWWYPYQTHVICHGTDLRILDKHRWLAWLLRPFARHVGKWQCVSEFLKGKLLDIYPFIQACDVLVEPMPLNPVFKNWFPWEGRFRQAIHVGGLRKNPQEIEIDGIPVVSVDGFSQSDLAALFNQSKYYISTSDFEGYCMTLREAKACGCKIISYVGDGRTEEDVDIVLGYV